MNLVLCSQSIPVWSPYDHLACGYDSYSTVAPQCVVDQNGNRFWKNAFGELHRDDGPAVEWADGLSEIWQNGEELSESLMFYGTVLSPEGESIASERQLVVARFAGKIFVEMPYRVMNELRSNVLLSHFDVLLRSHDVLRSMNEVEFQAECSFVALNLGLEESERYDLRNDVKDLRNEALRRSLTPDCF